MNYAAHYERLIERARVRVLTGYVERHHVVPVCMGGGNARSNIVALTPEEHYVAHQLLVKMHADNKSLVHAVVLMARKATGNKAFGWLRRRKAQAMLGNPSNTGRKLGPQSEKQKASMRGNAFALGLKHSPDTLRTITASSTGRTHTAEARAKISAAHAGKVMSKESKLKMSLAKLGKKMSEQARANMSASRIGNQNRLSIKHDAESRAKMSAAHMGRKHSEETKAKIGAAHKGRVMSVEHRAKIAATLTGRPAIRTPEGAARIAAAARKRMLSEDNPGRGRGSRL